MTYLKVSNFKRYQSADILKKSEYRPPWVKQWREFWLDYDLRTLRPETRLLALFLVSFSSEFLREWPEDQWGTFPNDPNEIARRSALPITAVRRGLDQLQNLGFLADVSLETPLENPLENPLDVPLIVEVEVEVEGRKNGSGSKDHAATPVLEIGQSQHYELGKLLAVIVDKDDHTEAVLTRYASQLPPGAIAKVRESSTGKPARYACAALKSEIQERA